MFFNQNYLIMKNRFNYIPILFILLLTVFSCDKSSDMDPDIDVNRKIDEPELHDNTDIRELAATDIAPEMTKILREEYNVLIYELTIEPGDTLPYHEHPHNSFYIIQGGKLEIIFEDLTSATIEFESGQTGIGAPSGDMAINRGETTIKVLMHEFYSLTIKENKDLYPVNWKEGAFYIAPNMTELKHDEFGIVIYELIIKPGETLPYHVHPYHSNYILEEGTLEVIIGNASTGNTNKYPEGRLGLGSPLADVAINRGETTIKVLMQEIYSLNP